ncbi:HAD family hydrolase [Marinobacter halodurans]|uniref:HAD family hydrolase n=2 Tax=Marinobacter halodurans TaxID=2528979 RepID=A0ABY1ZNR5_9GAMM|nr:HAD family hydrolase [Marinobacter halodurans]
MGTTMTTTVARYDAVVFDLDGTLVDSGLDFRAIRRELGFPEGVGLLEHMATLSEAEAARAHAIIHRFEMAGAEGASWMPGAEALVRHLHQRSVPVAVLTRNSREAVAATDAALSLGIDLVLTRDDAPPKPDPAGLLQIADTFGVAPNRMTYIGDFIDDLTTALRAGMAGGLYRNARNAAYVDRADYVIEHFDDLRRAWSD